MDCFDDPKVIDTCYKLESFKLLSFSKHKNIVYKDSLLKIWYEQPFGCSFDRFLLVILQIKSRKEIQNIIVREWAAYGFLSLLNLRKRKSSQGVPSIEQLIYPLRKFKPFPAPERIWYTILTRNFMEIIWPYHQKNEAAQWKRRNLVCSPVTVCINP